MRPILYIIILLQALNLSGQSVSAIDLYDKNKYHEALNEWNKIISQGAKGEQIYYNIANTYYRLHQYPEAILYYRKALKWNPVCSDCKHNLMLAVKAAGVESFKLPEFFLTTWSNKLILCFQPIVWFASGCILISLFLLLFIYKPQWIASTTNKNLFYFLIILGVVFLGIALQRDRIKHNTDEAVLIKSSTLRLSPDANSEIKQALVPGQTLIIKDQISNWYKVQTKEFDLGWIEKENIEIVSL